MKIIQLIYSLSSGGAEKFVVNLSNELANKGHEVIVCILRNGFDNSCTFNKKYLHSNVTFHAMNFTKGFSLRKVYQLEKFIKCQNPDIVHCHLNVIPYIFRIAVFCKNIKFVHTIHSIAEKASGLRIQYLINKWFYKRGLIKPITISYLCYESFKNYYKLDCATTIDNGCPRAVKSTEFEHVKAEVNSYKSSTDTTVYIHVARCSQSKNQRALISAFNQLDHENIDFVLIIIGNGFDKKENIDLKREACNKIYFLGEKGNVGDYLLCADAFCLTSLYEGLPISLIEAMSVGITPICTNVGGISDVIHDGQNGFLSESVNSEDFVMAVHRYRSSILKVENIIDSYENKFSINMCAKKYLKVYHSI